jgi:hypothetical protein
MYELILQLVLMASLAVIVYLMALAVPRVSDSEEKGSGGSDTPLPLDKIDTLLNGLKDKLLRRVKIVLMKTDNLISKQLNNKEEKL